MSIGHVLKSVYKVLEDSYDREPHWYHALDKASNDTIDKTGMSKKELRALLQYLYDERIIN